MYLPIYNPKGLDYKIGYLNDGDLPPLVDDYFTDDDTDDPLLYLSEKQYEKIKKYTKGTLKEICQREGIDTDGKGYIILYQYSLEKDGKLKKNLSITPPDICIICQSYQDDEDQEDFEFIKLSCNHLFHKKCIIDTDTRKYKILHCPICHEPINKEEIKTEIYGKCLVLRISLENKIEDIKNQHLIVKSVELYSFKSKTKKSKKSPTKKSPTKKSKTKKSKTTKSPTTKSPTKKSPTKKSKTKKLKTKKLKTKKSLTKTKKLKPKKATH
jgi:hypothetical protein